MVEKEISVELNLDVKEFEKSRDAARKRFNEEWTNDEKDSTYLFDGLKLESYEDEVVGNTLKIVEVVELKFHDPVLNQLPVVVASVSLSVNSSKV